MLTKYLINVRFNEIYNLFNNYEIQEDTTHTNQLQQQQRQQQQQHQQKSEVSVLTSQDTVTSSKENDTGQEEPPLVL